MKKDCRVITSKCRSCLQFNITRKGYHPLRTISASYPFDHVSIDLGRISTTSQAGNNYFLVLVDICTRFVIIRPMATKSALQVARILTEIFSNFGLPKIIQSDNGSEFINTVMKEMKKQCGFEHRTISSYYPQANGSAENAVKQVKTLLKKQINGDYTYWCLKMAGIQMAINSRITNRHHSSPFSLMFTRPFNMFSNYSSTSSTLMTEDQVYERNNLLTNLLYPSIEDATDGYNRRMMDNFVYSNRILKDGFPTGSMVMKEVDVRTSTLQPAYEGPFKVISRTAHNTYVLMDSTDHILPKNIPPSKLKMISFIEPEEDDKEYEIEKILNHRGKLQMREYLIKWKGYSEKDNLWIPASQIMTPQCITEYWKKNKK